MNTRPFYLGLIFIAIIAILANYLGNTDFSHHYHISALIIAILLGMAIGNTIYPQFSTQVEKGVLFAKGTLLRTGIVLYGFRLTFGDIADVGLNAVVTDAIMLISTFFFTALLGIRYLKMDKQLVYLTGAGCSICGAAAVMANTAIATAGDIPAMAEAFKKAIEAGRSAYLAGLGRVIEKGSSASSPLTGFLED